MTHTNTLHHNDATAHEFFEHGRRVEGSVTVRRTPQQIDRMLPATRALEPWGLSLSVSHDEIVIEFHHHGRRREWNIPLINYEPGELVAWRADDAIPNAGSINLHPHPSGRATEVRIVVEYLEEADDTGRAIKEVVGVPAEQFLRGALTRLRQELEAGGADMLLPRSSRLPI